MIPRWLMVPVTVSVVIGGIVYAVVLGAITGYFSAASGLLFVVSGVVGIVAAAQLRKALALLFLGTLVAANLVALAVNVAGVVDPNFITTMEPRDLGFMVIKPSVLWFLGGILFLAIFCIPCITIATVNVCLFRSRNPVRGRRGRHHHHKDDPYPYPRQQQQQQHEASAPDLPIIPTDVSAALEEGKAGGIKHHHHKRANADEAKRDSGEHKSP